MIELLVFVALAFAAVMVISVLGAVFGVLFGLLMLPFQLLGFLLKGVGILIALPFLLIGAVIGALVLGAGALLLLTPVLPLVLLVGVIWLFVRGSRRPVTA